MADQSAYTLFTLDQRLLEGEDFNIFIFESPWLGLLGMHQVFTQKKRIAPRLSDDGGEE